MVTSSPETSWSSTTNPLLNLKIGDSFHIQGPSVYTDITSPEDYPPSAPPSAQPPRPLFRALVGPEGIAQSSASWEVKVDNLSPESSDRIQPIICGTIRKEGTSEGYAVNLYISSPAAPSVKKRDYPQQIRDVGSPMALMVEEVAAHYHTYRNLQGREIPLCYGVVAVDLGGVRTLVSVEEALTAHASSLHDWGEMARAAEPKSAEVHATFEYDDEETNLTLSMFKSKVKSDFLHLRRFLSCDSRYLPSFPYLGSYVSDSSTIESIHYIHRSFSRATSTREVKAELRQVYDTYFSMARIIDSLLPSSLPEFDECFPGAVLAVALGTPVKEAMSQGSVMGRILEELGLNLRDINF